MPERLSCLPDERTTDRQSGVTELYLSPHAKWLQGVDMFLFRLPRAFVDHVHDFDDKRFPRIFD